MGSVAHGRLRSGPLAGLPAGPAEEDETVEIADIFVDAFTRIKEGVDAALEGLADAELTYRADPEANSIAWLVWHLTRVEDDHVSEVAGTEQAWTAEGWSDRFGLAVRQARPRLRPHARRGGEGESGRRPAAWLPRRRLARGRSST